MGKYFGTDGFRGEAGVTLTADHAYSIGRVLGYYYGRRKGARPRAVIGKDTRRSCYMLEYALAAGLSYEEASELANGASILASLLDERFEGYKKALRNDE